MLRLLLLPVAALFLSMGAGDSSARANDLPIRVDFGVRFNVDVGNRPQYKNLAPWYSYFPYDPHIHGRAQQFPTWPQTWPPAAPGKSTSAPPGMARTPVTYRPSYSPIVPASYTQPAGHFQAPSYWYGR